MRSSSAGAWAASFVLFFAALGCGSEADPVDASSTSAGAGSGGAGATTGTTSGTGAGGTDTTPTGDPITLAIEAFDVSPGTERQVCKIINLPADGPLDVVAMHSSMVGLSHHFNAYKVLDDTALLPVTEAEAMVHDCSPASEQLNGTAAYIFGSSAPERTLDLPEGVAFHLEPGQRIILEQHVINASPTDVIQGGVSYDLYPAKDPTTIEHYADIMWLASWSFIIPASSKATKTTACTVPYDIELFGITSHTHGLGIHFSIEKSTDAGKEHIYDSFDWQHPPYDEHKPTIAINAGDDIEWTCEWDNPQTHAVFPGKESTDEMCMTFVYAYPRGTMSADPYQCNK